jgi:hypothetical protein
MEDRFAKTIVVVAATVVASTTVAQTTSQLQRNETQLLSLQYCGTDRPG